MCHRRWWSHTWGRLQWLHYRSVFRCCARPELSGPGPWFGTSTGTFTLTVTSNVVSTPPPAIEIQVPSTVAGDTAANGYPWFSLGRCGPSFTGLGILYSLEAPGTGGITVHVQQRRLRYQDFGVSRSWPGYSVMCHGRGWHSWLQWLHYRSVFRCRERAELSGPGAWFWCFDRHLQPKHNTRPNSHPSPFDCCWRHSSKWIRLEQPGFCGTSITAPGILYSLEAPGTGGITVSTCNSASYNTKISVYQGADPATASCVTGLDDTPGCSGLTTKLSSMQWTARAFWSWCMVVRQAPSA